MNKTQASRLLTLAWYLKTEVPPSRFSMDLYAESADLHRCGTAACAFGWSTIVFPDQFRLETLCGFVNVFHGSKRCDYDSRFAKGFFGIDNDESYHLFSGDYLDRTPQQEANIIEKLVASKGWVYE